MSALGFMPQKMRAFVAFSGDVDWTPLRLLKDGFRHCFLLLNDGDNWIAFEPLLHRTNLFVLPTPPDFDLPNFLSAQSVSIVEAKIAAQCEPKNFLTIMSCVSQVKRVLGIQARSIVTPYQLYKFLQKEKVKWAVSL